MDKTTISYDGLESYFDMVKISASKVYNTAKKSGAKAVQPELHDDLYQSGMIALMEAWAKYDPSEGASFRTYAFYRIRGAMLDYLRGLDTVSRSTRMALKKIETNLDNTMTSSELSDEDISKTIRNSVVVFQYIAPSSDSGEGSSAAVEFPDSENKYKEIEAKETVSKLFKICPLTEKERVVVNDYYFMNKNFAEIGKSLEITESRISQIHNAALKKLAKYV